MTKFLLLVLVSLSVHAIEVPIVRVSTDKTQYWYGEKSVFLAEVNVSPSNAEYEFIVDGYLDENAVSLTHSTDFIWSEVSPALMVPGEHSWGANLFFIKKTFSAPIREAMKAKEAELAVETDPEMRTSLQREINNLKDEIVSIRRFVKSFTIDFTVLPNQLPAINLVAPANVQVANYFTIDASGSNDVDGQIVRYDWDLGDGHQVNNAGPVIVHNYDSEGQYNVILKVKDNWGAETTQTITITVSSIACVTKEVYESRDCQGTFVASSMEDLQRYSSQYGLRDAKYRNLKIVFPLEQSSTIEVHSPCKIFVQENLILKARNLCLEAKEGVSQSETFSVQASGDVFFLSKMNTVELPINSRIDARNFTMKSGGVSKVNSGATINVNQQLHIEGGSCILSPEAQIQAGSTSGNCF